VIDMSQKNTVALIMFIVGTTLIVIAVSGMIWLAYF